MTSARSLRVLVDGRITSLGRARLSVFDRGFLFGDGVYETLRVYSGRAFRIPQHLKRLANSTARLGFRAPASPVALAEALRRTIAANGFKQARARIVVTRGSGKPELGAMSGLRPTLFIYVTPYVPPSPARYRDGVKVIVAGVLRNDRRALDPAIKSLNLANNLLAKREAQKRRADDAVFLNSAGCVTEAIAANVFFVKRGVLCTPALNTGILPGVTRQLVIELARRIGISVREGAYRLRSLMRADEIFLTASTIEVLPVGVLENRRLPAGRPVTRALQEAYRITVRHELGLDEPAESG